MKIELRELRIEDEAAFYASLKPKWENNFVFAHYFEDTCKQDYSKYLNHLQKVKIKEGLPLGRVPGTLLFAFNDEGVIVGRSSIRHELNDHLLKEGGHIGYGVLPQFRRQGIASKILNLSLDYCRDHLQGVDKILVTCDEDNIASMKTIIKNGGVLENQVLIKENHPLKNRYWIKL